MKKALIYSLKVSLTSVIGTPVAFLLGIYLLAILPEYHVPELIAFVVAVVVLPCTLYISLIEGVCVFLMAWLLDHFGFKRYIIKLCLSVLSVFISYIAMAVLQGTSYIPMEDDYSYPLMLAFSIASFASIWLYNLKPQQCDSTSATTNDRNP